MHLMFLLDALNGPNVHWRRISRPARPCLPVQRAAQRHNSVCLFVRKGGGGRSGAPVCSGWLLNHSRWLWRTHSCTHNAHTQSHRRGMGRLNEVRADQTVTLVSPRITVCLPALPQHFLSLFSTSNFFSLVLFFSHSCYISSAIFHSILHVLPWS